MRRTRLSLFYLAGYLLVIGIAMLVAPANTLRFLLSNGDYGDLFPRLAGMLMSGLGLTIAGMIVARTEALYPATLAVRLYFLVCLVAFFWTSRDPFFLVVLGIVALGMLLTAACFWKDHADPLTSRPKRAP